MKVSYWSGRMRGTRAHIRPAIAKWSNQGRTWYPQPSRPCPNRRTSKSEALLGGPWVISRVTIVITHIRGLITLLITTHEPLFNQVFQLHFSLRPEWRSRQLLACATKHVCSSIRLPAIYLSISVCLPVYGATNPDQISVYLCIHACVHTCLHTVQTCVHK